MSDAQAAIDDAKEKILAGQMDAQAVVKHLVEHIGPLLASLHPNTQEFINAAQPIIDELLAALLTWLRVPAGVQDFAEPLVEKLAMHALEEMLNRYFPQSPPVAA